MSFSLLGIGSPLLDIQQQVSDDFIAMHVSGNKGGMEPVSAEEIENIVSRAGSVPQIFPGGAAGNTIFALSRFGVKSALRGKLANDKFKEKYFSFAAQNNVDTSQLIISDTGSTGCCLALVTSDAERTMRSALGVSLELTCDEISSSAFDDYDAVLIEGFMAYSGQLENMVNFAAEHNKFIIFDLASFEIAQKFKPLFTSFADKISMLVANEQEALAFTGEENIKNAFEKLSSDFPAVAVKRGADGVWFARGKEKISVPSFPAEKVVDTTAAGDLWLAGFIYAKDAGTDDRQAAVTGTMFASKIISHPGSMLTGADVQELTELIRRQSCNTSSKI